MIPNLSQSISNSFSMLMKPIIRIMLRNGVTYKAFMALCKALYVEAAEEYGIRGRPANISRIAILTGLDRKEIKRIKTLLEGDHTIQAAQQSVDRTTRLLTAWHQDPSFCSQDQPNILLDDDSPNSFGALIKKYGGDIPVTTWRKELDRLGLIEDTGAGYKVLKRNYFPGLDKEAALLRASTVINELGDTLHHNLYVAALNDAKPVSPRFERRASNNFIAPKHLRAFHQYLDEEGQVFLERVDAWLSAHEKTDSDIKDGDRAMRISVGLYGYNKINTQQDSEK